MWREFIAVAEKGDEPFSAICARFGVSRKTGYKWLNRFRIEGEAGLIEQSRRPKTSPRRTPDFVTDQVLALRRENPEWSAARISTELKEQGVTPRPAPSTIDLILRRRREQVSLSAHPDALRFEPNYRWTVRFGREIKISGASLQPVWVRDDTTHFIVGASLVVADNEAALVIFVTQLFQRHGRPWRLALSGADAHTALTVWLMRLGVGVDLIPAEHSPNESSSQQLAARLANLPSYQRAALEERLLKADLWQPLYLSRGISEKQAATLIEQIREQHNFGGKQEAMQQRTPLALYRPSVRVMPEELPAVNYALDADVRLVSEKGIFTFRRRLVHVGRAFAGLSVELKPTPVADHYVVLFAGQGLGRVDLSAAEIDETTSLSLHEV